MGLVAGVPFTIAPRLSFVEAFFTTAIATGNSHETVLACNIVVGLIVLLFAATSKRTRVVFSMPEDYRLGLAAGIGAFLALRSVRSMHLVVPGTTTFVTTFSYKTILGLTGIILIMAVSSMGERFALYSFIVSITVITVISVIVRAALDEPILPIGYVSGVASLQPLVESLPSFKNFTTTPNDYTVFEYILIQSVNKLVGLQATIVALILLSV